MGNIKSLIEVESGFLQPTDDLVSPHRSDEIVFLEEGIERMVRKTGIGKKVRCPSQVHTCIHIDIVEYSSCRQTYAPMPPNIFENKDILTLSLQVERQKTSDPDLHYFSAHRQALITRVLHTIAVSCLLVIPTLLLYIIQYQKMRLVIIAI